MVPCFWQKLLEDGFHKDVNTGQQQGLHKPKFSAETELEENCVGLD